MATIEKHGAFWYEDDQSDYRIVFERYDERTDLLAVVKTRLPNLYLAVVMEKGDDPQWRLPIWSELRPEALFDNEDEAVSHVLKLLEKTTNET
jgi:hypothetical protein